MNGIHLNVRRSGSAIVVEASIAEPVPVGYSDEAPPPLPHYEIEFVSEPGWFARLLGDTLEKRIARASHEVVARITEQVEQWRRLDRVVERVRA